MYVSSNPGTYMIRIRFAFQNRVTPFPRLAELGPLQTVSPLVLQVLLACLDEGQGC